ncbi:MAG: hypothetical protein QOI12_2001 [Alphaproteobacteria bacterium]|jgi:hypothetical protein|nr:hypothetical protein [Alphaproteobacteria bacterium]
MSDDQASADQPESHSSVGKWDHWYQSVSPDELGKHLYGDATTYLMAAAFMADIEEVEDWGCGTGGFRRFYQGKYTGLDGSQTPFADKIVDLCDYRSAVEGILIRHVLEHNHRWDRILKSAISSFRKKLCLVLFTPFVERTAEVAAQRPGKFDVPALSFNKQEIEKHFDGLSWRLLQDIKTQTNHGVEHVYFIWRPQG